MWFEKPKRKRKNDEHYLQVVLLVGMAVLALVGLGVYLLLGTNTPTPAEATVVPVVVDMQQRTIEASASIIVDQKLAHCPEKRQAGVTAYCTIQAGINAAQPGDIVLVRGGVYPENVMIAKPITLWGDSTMPVIDPIEGITIQVLTTPDQDTRLKTKIGSFVVRGTVTGMVIDEPTPATDLTIQHVTFQLTGDGIRVEDAAPFEVGATVTITGQTVFQVSGDAIALRDSTYVMLSVDNVVMQAPRTAIYVLGGGTHSIEIRSSVIQVPHSAYLIENSQYNDLRSGSDVILQNAGDLAYVNGGLGNHIYLENPALEHGALLVEDSPDSKIHISK